MARNHGLQIKNDEAYSELREKGMSKETAARIANSGKSASKRGGKRSPYEERSKDDLYELARKVGIEGRSKMTKGELIGALRNK